MEERLTPIRQQYLRIKKQYPQAIVLFRLGDFYETFDEDARITSRELEIVLTARSMGKGKNIPMAGIPYHALDSYLARLINHGHKVAICEQVTKPGKGLVQREVVRLVTPGTVVEPGLLESRANNFLVSLVIEEQQAGIACVDITTSEFAATQLSIERTTAELERLKPSEILTARQTVLSGFSLKAPVTRFNDDWLDDDESRRLLQEHFGVSTLEGFGCENLPLAVKAAAAILRYIAETQKVVLGQLTRFSTYSTSAYMPLDAQTQRNLELFIGGSGTTAGSLLSILDLTRTPMGGRLLRRWISQPLLDLKELVKRQDVVVWFCENTLKRNQVIKHLDDINDLERLLNRLRSNIALPREVVSLRRSLEKIPVLQELLNDTAAAGWLRQGLKPVPEAVELINRSIEEQPGTLDEGGVIKKGFSPELDKLRAVSGDARTYLANLEKKERERTGIKSLKLGFNHVFGYYIEVSNANLSQVPAEYIRKQTLTNGERFYTPELKEYESLILNSQERARELEQNLFRQVCAQAAAFSEPIMETAGALAGIDVTSSLAEAAVRGNYSRPELNETSMIDIKQGRHPVIERSFVGQSFIPNDTHLSGDDAQLIILTGPNMAGKSTYLRQVALIILMAQIGSFVPAASASIGLVDRIFTRIGARDDLATGKSTFMVEMVETANILNNATPRSLIILDEIGRGTSTYDGLAIARAVAEYIHNSPKLGAKTLFATHYHELIELAGLLPRVKNYNIAVTEENGEVVFLYRIVPGGVDRSYGIHVAKLAGLPRPVVHRAQEVLNDLEDARPARSSHRTRKDSSQQLSIFRQKPAVLEELEKLDINSLTPLEALTRLFELQKKIKE